MSKSFFSGLFDTTEENAPFPVLDDSLTVGLMPQSNRSSYRGLVNIFVVDGEDGLNYKIFEELPGLYPASIPKTVTAALLSDGDVFNFLTDEAASAVKHILDYSQGIYKGVKIDRPPKVKVTILFLEHILKRTNKLFEFLESKINESVAHIQASAISTLVSNGQVGYTEDDLRASLVYVLQKVVIRPLTELEILQIPESSSLRRFLYLWLLVHYLASPGEQKLARIRLMQLVR